MLLGKLDIHTEKDNTGPLPKPYINSGNSPPNHNLSRGSWVQSLDREDPLEKEMESHSSILAWDIPWTDTGGLQSMGSQKSQA